MNSVKIAETTRSDVAQPTSTPSFSSPLEWGCVQESTLTPDQKRELERGRFLIVFLESLRAHSGILLLVALARTCVSKFFELFSVLVESRCL